MKGRDSRPATKPHAGPAAATATSRPPRPWLLGVDAMDRALPESGLAPDGLHEASGAAAADGPAAAVFLAALLARLAHAGSGSVGNSAAYQICSR